MNRKQPTYEELERKLEKAEGTLREIEHYLNKVQQIAHFGSWIYDAKTNRAEFSDGMFNILGITKEQFDGTPEYALNLVKPEYRARVQESFDDLFIRRKSESLEYSIIRPDGSVRHLWGNGNVELDESGSKRTENNHKNQVFFIFQPEENEGYCRQKNSPSSTMAGIRYHHYIDRKKVEDQAVFFINVLII